GRPCLRRRHVPERPGDGAGRLGDSRRWTEGDRRPPDQRRGGRALPAAAVRLRRRHARRGPRGAGPPPLRPAARALAVTGPPEYQPAHVDPRTELAMAGLQGLTLFRTRPFAGRSDLAPPPAAPLMK